MVGFCIIIIYSSMEKHLSYMVSNFNINLTHSESFINKSIMGEHGDAIFNVLMKYDSHA